jgi:MFS transporter, DHA1 family, multidrug resistance protein
VRWLGENRVLVWMCVLIGVNQLGFGSIVPVVPLYAASFNVSTAAIGLAIAVYGLARFLVNLPAGRLADRIGRRGTLATGGLVTVLGNIACGLAPSYPLFLGGRFVAGAGAAMILTAGQIVLADITVPARRGRVMGIYSGVFAFAVGAGPLPGGLLAERFGLPAPFFGFAALSAAAAAVAWFGVPETRGLALGHPAYPRGSAGVPLGFVGQLRLLGSNTGFLLVSLVSFSAAVARTGGLFNVVPLLARGRLGLAADQIGLGLSLISLGALLLAYPSGAMVDRLGRKAVIVPAMVVTGLSVGLFALATSYAWYLAACAVWSIGLGISSDAPGAYAADSAPPGMNAAAMSAYRMLSDCGYVLGPLVLGLIADGLGGTTALVATGALLVGSGALFARLAPETYRPRAAAAVELRTEKAVTRSG